MEIYVHKNGSQVGPYTVDELRDLIERGELQPDDWGWTVDLGDWVRLRSFVDAKVVGSAEAVSTQDTLISVSVGIREGKREMPPEFRSPALALLWQQVSGISHPDYPFLEKLYSPGSTMNPGSVYRNVVMHYCRRLGIAAEGMGPHALRATSATNALLNGADIAEVQEWLGRSSNSTTRLYDRRKMRAEG